MCVKAPPLGCQPRLHSTQTHEYAGKHSLSRLRQRRGAFAPQTTAWWQGGAVPPKRSRTVNIGSLWGEVGTSLSQAPSPAMCSRTVTGPGESSLYDYPGNVFPACCHCTLPWFVDGSYGRNRGSTVAAAVDGCCLQRYTSLFKVPLLPCEYSPWSILS
jgi:hypothetical protein